MVAAGSSTGATQLRGRELLVWKSPTAMLLNWTSIGQAIAVVLDGRNSAAGPARASVAPMS